MKRILCLFLTVLLIIALFAACKAAEKPGASPETDPKQDDPKTFEGCTNASACGLNREDDICSAVILNTDEGKIGLLIPRGTIIELPPENDASAVSFKTDGIAESFYFNGDTEVRAEGCVKMEKPKDLELTEPAEAWYKPEKLTVLTNYVAPSTTAKPVIYLYPEQETEVNVRLDFAGDLTCTYPAYGNGWTVTAAPDGTLTDAAGKIYSYLFWEGENGWDPDFSRGFCVPGAATAAFLEDALPKLGLNPAEANEFIVYWLPRMQNNPWNLISFQQEAYTDAAKLDVSPNPDTVIRVFMAWQKLDAPVSVEPQILEAPARTGFTVVEWGGREVCAP